MVVFLLMKEHLVGSGSIVHERVKIGKNCIISAGSVIKDDVPDNTMIK